MSIWSTQIWSEEYHGDLAFHLDTTIINDEYPFRIGFVVGTQTAEMSTFKLLTVDEATELRDKLSSHLDTIV